jgi:predicted nucleic acid-binding protein
MPGQRRLWDSSVIIGYLAGEEDLAEPCENIIENAERGEIEIVISVEAGIEVAYLDGRNDETSEAMIRELFDPDYIIPAGVDMRIAAVARELIRKYRNGPKLKPKDATHLATAIQWRIPILETKDPDLLRLDGREGDPTIMIRRPLYEGTRRMVGF